VQNRLGILQLWDGGQQDRQILFHVIQPHLKVIQHRLPIIQIRDRLFDLLPRQAGQMVDLLLSRRRIHFGNASHIYPAANKPVLPRQSSWSFGAVAFINEATIGG
jgi:hypothetical protein